MTNYSWFIVIFVAVWLCFQAQAVTVKAVVRRRQIRKLQNQREQNGRITIVKELVKRFIGEECYIDMISGGCVQGVIREVDDGGIMIENKSGGFEILNLDFVVNVKQKKQKDKRKI